MTFEWPSMLYALGLIPVLIYLYARVQRRRRVLESSFGQAFSSREPRKRSPGVRRHLPALLFLVALFSLLVALARPKAEVNLPRVEGTVILVMDVSGSMAATDVEPTRMEAAKKLAKEFILNQPESLKIGIVSFSGSGFVVQRPTNNQQTLLSTIDHLRPQNGTSLGQGIVVALNSIAIDAGLEPDLQAPNGQGQSPTPDAQPMMRADQALLEQLPEGSFPSAVIVLISDGENNQSIDPLEASQAAAQRDVRVNAVGVGTAAGTTLEVGGFNVHTALDEGALQQIVQVAGGVYYNAQNEQDPQSIYKNITPQLVVKPEMMEITFLLTGAGILAMLLGAALSMLWFNRFP